METAGTFAVGATPINMIIGPPDGSGNYSNSNNSINDGHFSPYIDGSGTFVIDDSAITSSTTITGVSFLFGTKPDYTEVGSACTPGTAGCVPGGGDSTPVPEPATLAVFGGGLFVLALMRRSKRTQLR
jgi:hypothetical protein